jgi:hypothetical protein
MPKAPKLPPTQPVEVLDCPANGSQPTDLPLCPPSHHSMKADKRGWQLKPDNLELELED